MYVKCKLDFKKKMCVLLEAAQETAIKIFTSASKSDENFELYPMGKCLVGRVGTMCESLKKRVRIPGNGKYQAKPLYLCIPVF